MNVYLENVIYKKNYIFLQEEIILVSLILTEFSEERMIMLTYTQYLGIFQIMETHQNLLLNPRKYQFWIPVIQYIYPD
jgi:hypothetical protein